MTAHSFPRMCVRRIPWQTRYHLTPASGNEFRIAARFSGSPARPATRLRACHAHAPRRSARTTTVVGTHDTTRGSTGAIWHAPRLACPVSANGPNGSHAASLIFRRPECQIVFYASQAEHAANQDKLRASTCAAARVSPSAQHDQPSVSATPMRTHRGGRHARPLRLARSAKARGSHDAFFP